ncbi:hypothetical protein P9112_002121 [Eukaryota sp. TZLM1-RC]
MTQVLRDVLRKTIDKYLGTYVEGLDKDSLKLSVFSGNIALSNLTIKPDALKDIHPLFAVRRGTIGNLEIKLSWAKLKSKPVVVNISDVFLLVSPKTSIEFGANAAHNTQSQMQQDKQTKLDAYETTRESALRKADGEVEKQGKIAALITHIISNIQLNFSNIHLRLEDPNPSMGTPMSFGAILNGITICSTGEDFSTREMSSATNKLFKLVDVSGLGVYADELLSRHQLTSSEHLSNPNVYRKLVPTVTSASHNWLIEPAHLSLKVSLNKGAGQSDGWSQPKINARLCFSDENNGRLKIGLADCQILGLYSILDSMSRFSKMGQNLEFRPGKTVTEAPKEWWLYAINSTLKTIKQRREKRSLSALVHRKVLSRQYIALFQRSRDVSFLPSLSSKDKKRISEIEEELGVNDLLYLRNKADSLLAKQIKEREEKGEAVSRRAQKKDHKMSLLSAEEQEEILNSLEVNQGLAETLSLADVPLTYVHTRVQLVFNAIEISLKNSDFEPLLNMEFNNAVSGLSLRSNSTSVMFKLWDFRISAPKNHPNFQTLVCKQINSNSKHLLKFNLTINPVETPGLDTLLSCSLQPLRIFADLPTFLRIAHLFSPPPAADFGYFTSAIYSAFDDLKSRAVSGVQSAIDSRTSLSLNLDVSTPSILVPYSIFTDAGDFNSNDGLEVKLGHLKAFIDPHLESRQSLVHGVSAIYDNVSLNFTSLSAELVKGESRSVLFEGLEAQGKIKANISKEDLFNPLSVIEMNVTPLVINMSEQSIYDLLTLMNFVINSLDQLSQEFPRPPPSPEVPIDLSQDEIVVLPSLNLSGDESESSVTSLSTTSSIVLEQSISQINFVFEGIEVIFSTEIPVLHFNLSTIKTSILIRRRDIGFSASLAGFKLTQTIHTHSPVNFLSVTGSLPSLSAGESLPSEYTPEGQFAIVVGGAQYQPGHPKYTSEDEVPLGMDVSARVAQIMFNFDPFALLTVIEIGERVASNAQELLSFTPTSSQGQNKGINTQSETDIVGEDAEPQPSFDSKVNFNFQMDKFSVSLEKFHTEASSVSHLFFTTISLNKINATGFISKGKTCVSSQLTSVFVTNPLSSCWPYTIKSLVGKDDVIFSVDVELNETIADSKFEVVFAHIQALFCGPFIVSLLDYLHLVSTEFAKRASSNQPNSQTLSDTNQNSETQSSDQTLEIPNISFKVANFEVVLPKSLEAPDCLSISIQRFGVFSKIFAEQVTESTIKPAENMIDRAGDPQLSRVDVILENFTVSAGTNICNDANLNLSLLLVQSSSNSNYLGVCVDLLLGTNDKSTLDFSIDQTAIDVSMGSIFYNTSYLSKAQSLATSEKPDQPSTQSKSNGTTTLDLVFNFNLNMLNICLVKGTQDCLIGRLGLENMKFSVDYATLDDRSQVVSASFGLGSILVNDRRSISDPCFQSITAITDYAQNSDAITIDFSLKQQQLIVDLLLRGCYFCAVPDFLVDLVCWFTDAMPNVGVDIHPNIEELEELVGSDSQARPNQQDQDEAQSSQSSQESSLIESAVIKINGRLDLVIPDCQYYFGSELECSNALVLSLTPKIITNINLLPNLSVTSMISFDAVDVTAVELPRSNDKAVVFILDSISKRIEPQIGIYRSIVTQMFISSTVSFKTVSLTDESFSQVLNVDSEFGNLSFCISYNDIRVCSFVLNHLLEVFNEQQPRLTQQRQGQSNSQSFDVSDSETTNHTDSESNLIITASVTMPNTSLVLTDDSASQTGLPLAKFSFTGLSTEFVSKQNAKNIVVDFGFEGWLWNDTITNYDCFIEPFLCSSTYSIIQESSSKQSILGSLTIDKGVELVVSAPALNTVSSIIPTIVSNWSAPLSKTSVHLDFAPVWVVNYTGCSLAVTTHVPVSNLDDVCHQNSDPINVLIEHNSRRGFSVTPNTQIQIFIDDILVTSFCQSELTCPRVATSALGEVLVSTEFRNRSCFITISGVSFVDNFTDIPFFVFPSENTRLLSKPGSRVFMPIHKPNSHYYVKPQSDCYGNSQPLDYSKSCLAECQTQTNITEEDLTGPSPGLFKVCCIHESICETNKNLLGNKIVLKPPFTLANSLPYNLEVLLTHAREECSTKSTFTITLTPLEVIALYHVDPRSVLGASVRPDDKIYGWSRVTSLCNSFGKTSKNLTHLIVPVTQDDTREGSGSASDLALLCEITGQGKSHCSLIEETKNTFTPLNFKFWVPLIVSNHSSQPIAIFPSSTSQKKCPVLVCRSSSLPILFSPIQLADKLESKSDSLAKIKIGTPGSSLSPELSPLPSASIDTMVRDGQCVHHFALSSPTSVEFFGKSFVEGAKPLVAGGGRFSKTTSIKGMLCGVYDRFVIRNELPNVVHLSVAAKDIISLPSKIPAMSRTSLNPNTTLCHKSMHEDIWGFVVLSVEGYRDSVPFCIWEPAEFTINLLCDSGSDSLFIDVFIEVVGAQVYVSIGPSNAAHPPFKIINNSFETIDVIQVCSFSNSDPLFKCHPNLLNITNVSLVLAPSEEAPFAFPVPFHSNTIQLRGLESKSKVVIRKNRLGIFNSDERDQNGIICHVDTDGPTRVLSVFTASSDKGQKLSDKLNFCEFDPDLVNVVDTPLSAGTTVSFQVNVPAFGISFISSFPSEIGYFGIRGINVEAESSNSIIAIESSIAQVQLLDHLPKSIFPIVFDVSPQGTCPSVEFRVQINQSHEGVTCFDYVGLHVQPITLSISDRFFTQFLRTFSSLFDPQLADVFMPKPVLISPESISNFLKPKEPELTTGKANRVYIGKLELEPLLVSLSTELSPLLLGTGPRVGRALISTAGSLSQVELKFPSLHLKYVFEIPSVIVNKMIEHYKQAGIREGYKILGCSNMIGAPYALFNHLGTGLKSLYYEPRQGALSHSPLRTVQGVGTGIASAAKHTWQGAFGVVSSLTGSIARLSAGLSMDDCFVQKQGTARPSNVGQGLVQGTRGLGQGVWSGVSGLVTQPVSGAKKGGGIGGFAKGFGKGVVGLVAKPVSGIGSFASNLSEGLKQQVDASESSVMRLPRHTRKGHPVEPFSHILSGHQSYLRTLQSGKYSSHDLIDVFPTKQGSLIVSSGHVLNLDEKQKVKWRVQLSDLVSLNVEGCHLSLRKAQDKTKYSVGFSSAEVVEGVTNILTQESSVRRL